LYCKTIQVDEIVHVIFLLIWKQGLHPFPRTYRGFLVRYPESWGQSDIGALSTFVLFCLDSYFFNNLASTGCRFCRYPRNCGSFYGPLFAVV